MTVMFAYGHLHGTSAVPAAASRAVVVGEVPNETIVSAFIGWSTVVAVTASGRVYRFGRGGHDPVELCTSVHGGVAAVSGHWDHIAVVTCGGHVHILSGVEEAPADAPLREHAAVLPAGMTVAAVAVTTSMVYAVSTDRSQLLQAPLAAEGPFDFDIVYTAAGDCPRNAIASVSAGSQHVALCTAGGQLLTFGQGIHGQLGHGNADPQRTPWVVEALDGLNIVAVACGALHTLALSNEGDVYAFGSNIQGQCGIGSPNGVYTPSVVDTPDNIDCVGVAAGDAHSLLVGDDGRIVTFGSNASHQLGRPQEPSSDSLPHRSRTNWQPKFACRDLCPGDQRIHGLQQDSDGTNADSCVRRFTHAVLGPACTALFVETP